MTVDLDWRDRAACRTVSPDLFFAPEVETRPARKMRERSALMVCASCPVTVPCLASANTAGDTHSISGGLLPEERLPAQRSQQYSNTRRAQEAAARRAELEAAGEKRCTGPCGQMKPLSDFSVAQVRLRSDCKECRNAGRRRHRREQAS